MILPANKSFIPGGNWLILDSGSQLVKEQKWDLIIDFSDHIDQPNRLSLTRYLYENHDALVREAASRIDAMGQAKCAEAGQTVVKALEVYQGFSFWYISGAFEKCIVRNPELAIYLKCLALEQLMVLYRPQMLAMDGLAELPRFALDKLAKTLGIDADNPFNGRKSRRIGFMPHLRALARFTVLFTKSFSLIGCRDWPRMQRGKGKERSILFVAYSPNCGPGQDDCYDPIYWKGLPEIAAQEFDNIEWCHLYDASAGESERALSRRMERLESVAGYPHHLYLLEQRLSPRLVMRAFMIYMRLQLKLAKVERALKRHPAPSDLMIWPFLEEAWQRSTKGGTAASLAVQVLLLEGLAKKAGEQPAFFLYEGMPWERTLLYFWRRQGNGPIFGYQHATVKTCDLRLLSSLAFGPGYQEWLLPDGILFNGYAAGKVLRSIGFDDKRIHPIEALRFNYLLDLQAITRSCQSDKAGSVTVLVILEGIESIDRFILEFVKEALSAPAIATTQHFVIKPHPSGRVSVSKALKGTGIGAWTETREGIHSVLAKANLVCTSINSSAAVEVQALGLTQILIWKPSELIRTPLIIRDWGKIVTSPSAFISALDRSISGETDDPAPVFYLDKALPRWSAMLRSL
jgi:surface carbohydrate biosynthesis protein (TIGR04326 family)